jgi:crotonobetainyl-CoA:carnitine CoA-transferase CaiB-like acyl-CoA transferase
LLDLKPDLVVVRMPAFGLTGPWRDRVGFAPTMEQIAGLAWVTGLPDGPPVPPRGACDPLAGAHAAFALLAALEFADRTGRGQLVEMPMIETVLNVTATQTIEFEVFDEILVRRGNRGHPTATQDLYRCAGDDTWIALCAHTDAQRKALSELTSGTELAEWLAAQDVGAVVDVLTGAGIPAAVVVSPSLVTDNPQLRHRGFFERLDHPRTGEGWYPTPPFALLDGAERWLPRASRRSVPRCAGRSPRAAARWMATATGHRCKARRRQGISRRCLLVGLPRPSAELGDRAFAAGQLRTVAIDLVLPDRDVSSRRHRSSRPLKLLLL